jgi:hypothetical protein
VIKAGIFRELLMEKFDSEFFVGVSEGAEFEVFAGFLLEDAAAILAFVSLRVVKLFNLIMRQQASPVPAVALSCAFQVRVRNYREVPTSVTLPMVKPAGGILIVAGVRQLTWRSFEGLQVKAEKLVLLQVGQLIGMGSEAVIRALTVGLARGCLVDEWMEADLVSVVRVLAGLIRNGVLGLRKDKASEWGSRVDCSPDRGSGVGPHASGSKDTRG